MKLLAGEYVADNSDLLVEIHKVQYQNDEIAKVIMSLYCKHTGWVYEVRKNYKLVKSRITHWKRPEKK